VKVLGLEDNIIFRGVLSPAEVMNLFSESLALVQHSVISYNGDEEGTPVAILEASAAGIPVIATRHAGIPDVVVHGETGFLVDELDIDGMAFYMAKLVEDPELTISLGSKGRSRIRNNFTMRKHLDALDDLIAQSI
jgi:glycosyltransferase involved in cell wall biosynthesis